MSISEYGFLKGVVIETKKEVLSRSHKTPHYQIWLEVQGAVYRVAVNVYSRAEPHALRYWTGGNTQNEIFTRALQKPDGCYSNLPSGLGGECVDYLRGHFFNLQEFIVPTNKASNLFFKVDELENLIDKYVGLCKENPDIKVCVWGQLFFNRRGEAIGIHDVHMNQGDAGNFMSENGIWQDGCLIVFNDSIKEILFSLFLSFQSQCLQTDNVTGNCLNS